MIRIDLNDTELSELLDRLAVSLTDLTPVMQDMCEYMVDATKQRFTEGKAPDGTAWTPKSQATIDAYRYREAKGRNARVDFRPLFGPSGRLSSEIHYQADATSVEFGSSLIYAAVQQFGAEAGAFGARMGVNEKGRRYFMPIPWGNIPARPFIGVSEADKTALTEIVEEWLQGVSGK